MYDLMGCSAKDRAAGEYHSVSVLHVPGKAQLLLHHSNALMLPASVNPDRGARRLPGGQHCWLQAFYANVEPCQCRC